MKLKEAKVLARIKGLGYVAVDRDRAVYAFEAEPELCENFWEVTGSGPFVFLGYYSGNKDWEDTLREVS